MNIMLEKTKTKSNVAVFHIESIPGLTEVEKSLYNAISDSHKLTHSTCVNLIQSGGKRIRPLLVLCAAQCFGPLKQEMIQTATACELIHMASLIHDDIIDESKIRRNRPTVNAKMGNQASVLIGDYLFAKAFEILSANKLIESMNLIVEAISEMCDGEIFQANNKFNLDQTLEDYYQRIYKKTAILIAACCQAGAIAAGGSIHQIKALKKYGTYLGYAYQVVDDILDFIGNEKMLGKPVGCDLRGGNITLPILKLIEQEEYKNWLRKIFNEGKITTARYKEILRVLKDSYAIQESYREAEICIQKAKNALAVIEDSAYKEILLNIADKLLIRCN